jgi:hypothetical protein
VFLAAPRTNDAIRVIADSKILYKPPGSTGLFSDFLHNQFQSMSLNPDSAEPGKQFSASLPSTGRSSKHPEAGWDSTQAELKHQPGRNTAPQNTVEVFPRGTHLPPDRTFLPQNDERNVPADVRQDPVGTGLTNADLQQTLGGTTSKTVHHGMGMPGDQNQVDSNALGDGGKKGESKPGQRTGLGGN